MLTIRLPLDLRRRLKAHAAQEGKTVQEIVATLIETQLKLVA